MRSALLFLASLSWTEKSVLLSVVKVVVDTMFRPSSPALATKLL